MSLIVLPLVLPLLGAFLLQPLERVSRLLARGLGPLLLVVSAWLIWGVWRAHGGAPFAVAIGGFAAPLGIVFYVDRLALLFALAVPLYGLLFWPRGKRDGRSREEALMLLLLAASTGLALSGDLFNLYVFYELVAIASLGLAAGPGTGRAQLASVRYLFISGLGSVLAQIGITIVYIKTGTLNLAQLAQLGPTQLHDPLGLAGLAALVIGFGVKAELFPVNTWVAEVYGAGPRRLAAILAGLVSKLAVLVVLRLLVLVFDLPEARYLLLVLGLLGMVTGELAAWRAKDFSRMLAYSSIGQLGIVFIALSVPGPAGVLGALAVILHHLLVKPALFALAERWGGSLERLVGAATRAPLAACLLVMLCLSLVGVPPLPGFWTKLLVLVGLAEQGEFLHLLAFAGILVTTVVEAHYLFRIVVRVYRKVPQSPLPPAGPDLARAALLGAAVVAVTLAIAPAAQALRGVARQAADVGLYVATVHPSSTPGRDLRKD
jgi:formate hydrogenlyase subunit 3/multisubunit Na+/H+ antiporter MnhD subunit